MAQLMDDLGGAAIGSPRSLTFGVMLKAAALSVGVGAARTILQRRREKAELEWVGGQLVHVVTPQARPLAVVEPLQRQRSRAAHPAGSGLARVHRVEAPSRPCRRAAS